MRSEHSEVQNKYDEYCCSIYVRYDWPILLSTVRIFETIRVFEPIRICFFVTHMLIKMFMKSIPGYSRDCCRDDHNRPHPHPELRRIPLGQHLHRVHRDRSFGVTFFGTNFELGTL